MGLTVGNDETPGVGDKIEELRTMNNMTMTITFEVNVTAN
jgi:Na+-translocating ferredoxin:NAD+ oxidoreductase RnfG subunit